MIKKIRKHLALLYFIRYCTKDAFFSVKEVDVGLVADIGTLPKLIRIVGREGWVRDVVMTGRNVKADEALKVGLVEKIYDNQGKINVLFIRFIFLLLDFLLFTR